MYVNTCFSYIILKFNFGGFTPPSTSCGGRALINFRPINLKGCPFFTLDQQRWPRKISDSCSVCYSASPHVNFFGALRTVSESKERTVSHETYKKCLTVVDSLYCLLYQYFYTRQKLPLWSLQYKTLQIKDTTENRTHFTSEVPNVHF